MGYKHCIIIQFYVDIIITKSSEIVLLFLSFDIVRKKINILILLANIAKLF